MDGRLRVWIFVIWSVFVGLSEAKFSDSLKVTLSHGGGVYGRYLTSQSGRGIRAFRGIPYAEPPIGELRFSDPAEKAAWTGFVDGEKNRVVCPQIDYFFGKTEVEGQEDCLFLNVFVPQSPNSRDLLPVMFYIHGGGYMTGTGDIYGPDYIMDHDVILVTGNYRLGALGFLSTQTKELPGNFGSKDQNLMLKWVQKNIRNFGGDPEKVTIFGQSAGSASVGLHMTSNMSKGLFRHAIMQSGTPYSPWAVINPKMAVEHAEKLFQVLGCPSVKAGPAESLKCLRKKSASEITQTVPVFFEWDKDAPIPFGPVIESKESTEPFMSREMFNTGADKNIPLMIGLTSHEAAFKIAPLSKDKEFIANLEKDLDKYLPALSYYSHFEEKLQITKKVKEFYFQNQPFTWKKNMFSLIDVLGDQWFLPGINQFLAKRFKDNQRANTYFYLLDYRGEASFSDAIFGNEEDASEDDFGVCHGDDLMQLFPFTEEMVNFRTPTEADKKMRNKFVQMWIDFGNFGQPFKSSQDKKRSWRPTSKFPLEYMRIGRYNSTKDKSEIGMETDLWPERSEFWKQFNPQDDSNNKDEL